MSVHRRYSLPLPGSTIALGETPIVMGILNLTPDSFSDGGDNNTLDAALSHARKMAAEGADIIDIGGESTRPGAEDVGVQEELNRVIPILERLRSADDIGVPLSIDTYKALVADQAVQSGVSMINDVHGLLKDPEIADVAALHKVPVIIMHWDPERDRDADIVDEMARHFARSLEIAARAGIPDQQIVLDPGFGFAKSLKENYEVLRRLDELHNLGFPVLAGTSRKSMIGKLLNIPPKERLSATIAINVLAYTRGAHIFRVHDVREHREALAAAAAILYGPPEES